MSEHRARGEHRPDPDALLAHVTSQEARRRRGKLKVFFGAAAGVGKTYAMLEAARAERADGVDVVVGWVEPHGRAETEALLEGLEVLPPRMVEYRGTTLKELDLDAALTRRPTILVVDELAHTNAPDSRHAKRWQAVLELLDAGIHVYTTVNVQHLESLNDLVAQITGVVVRETVPDSVLDHADEVELIDLPPDELLERLREGKVYVPEQAREAVDSFFRKGNLIALRELALRRTAARVDAEMREYMRDHAIRKTWPVAERLLVCLGPSPHAPKLVRAAKLMAERLGAEWIAAYVETPGHDRLPQEARDRVVETLRLAERLGAEVVTVSGARMSDEILALAHERNVSKIVVGKPGRGRWRRVVQGSIVDTLVEGSGDIDVYVLSGEKEPRPAAPRRPRAPGRHDWVGYGYAVLITAAITAPAWVLHPWIELANLIMLYLVGVVATAMRTGRGPAALAAVLSVAAFDFFFVPPYLTFAVHDGQYLVTFAVMLLVGLVISGLTVRLRAQVESARRREHRIAALYAMTRELATTRGIAELATIAVRHIAEVFGGGVTVLLPDGEGQLTPVAHVDPIALAGSDLGVARWVHEHGKIAGQGTDTLPGASGVFLPLLAAGRSLGVLGLRPTQPEEMESPEHVHQLETFASQTAQALERGLLAEQAQAAEVRAETERLRNSLLSSVSHDLRTPLAAITGAVSTLLESHALLDGETRRDLLETVRDEAEGLNRLVQNLLEMTRLEAGALAVQREWHPLEEIVGAALGRLARRLGDRPVVTTLPADLPMVQVDDVLLEQVLLNLVDNAVKYTPPGSPIEISASLTGDAVILSVADHGPGIAPGDESRIFERFYRGGSRGQSSDRRGVGLGLAICEGIVTAHGGRIWAENRSPGSGLVIRVSLPATGAVPAVALEER